MRFITSVSHALVGVKNYVTDPASRRNQITPLKALGAVGVLLVIIHLANSWMRRQRQEAEVRWDLEWNADPTSALTLEPRRETSVSFMGLWNKLLNRSDIKGTVSLGDPRFGGPLGKDTFYAFRKRITREDGSPWEIPEDDLVICLEGTFARGEADLKKNAMGLPSSSVYLPSCLLSQVNEKGVILFRFDGKLVELMVQPPTGSSFEIALAKIKACIRRLDGGAAWVVDTPESYWKAERLGPMGRAVAKFQRMYPDVKSSHQIKALDALVNQEVCSLNYSKINIICIDEQRVVLWLPGIDPEDYYLCDFKCDDHYAVWVVVPHQLEKNQWPSDGETMTLYRGKDLVAEFTQDTYNPLEHRRTDYVWGKFIMLELPHPLSEFKVIRNEQGCLIMEKIMVEEKLSDSV